MTIKKYTDWIRRNVSDPIGKCIEYTEKMAADFPELTIVRGHYHCQYWGVREHWWLIDERGNIIDPTANQYPSQGAGCYTPWSEGNDEPTGKCLNCGAYSYHGSATCSAECFEALCKYFKTLKHSNEK
jgi:hypothetical protein